MNIELTEYLMAHGILKGADAQKMAEEIAQMLAVEKLTERNHELEQKELLRSASRPAEAEAMKNVLGESDRLREQLDAAQEALSFAQHQHTAASDVAAARYGERLQSLENEHLRKKLDAMQKANAELREFALTHFSREQVKPLVEACQAMLDLLDWGTWRTEYTDGRGFLEHLADHILPAVEQALAHARAVGMEDKP